MADLGAKRIILDTDMGYDVDDAGALALLHALADTGEAEIAGVAVCTNGPYGPGCADAINQYYGRPEIPVGVLKQKQGFLDGEKSKKYTQVMAEAFPNRFGGNLAAVPDATGLYRKILSGSKTPITIVAIGPLINLRNLLLSPGDEYSSMTGKELIEKTVESLVVMGGGFPDSSVVPGSGIEWNFQMHPESAASVVQDWPTPIVFAGFELGAGIITGRNPIRRAGRHNPVAMAYAAYSGTEGRMSWDLCAVLYAVRGCGTFWSEIWGSLSVDPVTGANRFSAASDARVQSGTAVVSEARAGAGTTPRAYLAAMAPTADIAEAMDALIFEPRPMTERGRFHALFSGKKVDRLPVYFFGSWKEAKLRWIQEGLAPSFPLEVDYGPQLEGMDADWEQGLWDCHGFVNAYPIFPGKNSILEETEDHAIIRYPSGALVKHGKGTRSIPHTIEFALAPTRESWERFKRSLDPELPSRYAPGWEQKATAFALRDRVAALMGGSLYGWLRDWMGVEALSLLMYDDEPLLREMIDHIVDHCIRLFGPVAKKADFDFVYIFEDCCGSYGPLFSPEKYDILFDGPYRRLIDFYKRECRIPFILIDSDGVPDALVPCWLKSGFDIIFPVEVGKWKGSPNKLRNRFGCDFGMLGGVDKHLIRQGGQALRDHLTELLPAVRGGRYLPIPDHRIPPEVSLQDMQKYIALFNEVFNG